MNNGDSIRNLNKDDILDCPFVKILWLCLIRLIHLFEIGRVRWIFLMNVEILSSIIQTNI